MIISVSFSLTIIYRNLPKKKMLLKRPVNFFFFVKLDTTIVIIIFFYRSLSFCALFVLRDINKK
ncbi:hypothetical protein C2G38_2101966 [Gigaspora rosea]|uniref:Uncharacterized protein n=1 Tax=Gigaspora rosea TaxID=44941 RepID=A0A397UQF3_9GLOM|nr:hypothetical protein C2G38_2101966 [Gigaspora rosea]